MTQEGYLHILIGPMFSGKTSALLRLLFNEAAVGLNVLYINHERDNRSAGNFSTHNPLYREKLAEKSNVTFVSAQTLETIEIHSFDVIGVDEAQFFSDLNQINHWTDDYKIKVIVAGLDGDFRREKFGGILDLIPRSNKVEKLTAYCKACASKNPKVIKLAYFTLRTTATNEVILVGGSDDYQPVCRECYLSLIC